MENTRVSIENAHTLQCEPVFPLMSSVPPLIHSVVPCHLKTERTSYLWSTISFFFLTRWKKKTLALSTSPFFLLEISDCWLAINLQNSLQIIVWRAACKPASSSLLLPNLSTCLVLAHMPGTDLAGSIITCVGFVCHRYHTKKLPKWFLLGDERRWGRGQDKTEPIIPLELHVNKRWGVKIFWVSLYILKKGKYKWSLFAFIQVPFQFIFQVIPCSALVSFANVLIGVSLLSPPSPWRQPELYYHSYAWW